MRLILISAAAVALVTIACGGKGTVNAVPAPAAPSSQPSPTPVPTAVIPANGDYPGRGKVVRIDPKAPSVELDHEEIKGVMPAMIMQLNVSERSLLDGLKAGDEVDFVLRYQHPTETIVKITKRQ